MIKKRQVLTFLRVTLVAFLIGTIINVNSVTIAGKDEKDNPRAWHHSFYHGLAESPVIPSPSVWAPGPYFNTQGYKRFSILIMTKEAPAAGQPCDLTPYANLYFGIEISQTELWARIVDQIPINSWLPRTSSTGIYQSEYRTYEIVADYFHIDIVNRVGCIPLEFNVYVYVTT